MAWARLNRLLPPAEVFEGTCISRIILSTPFRYHNKYVIYLPPEVIRIEWGSLGLGVLIWEDGCVTVAVECGMECDDAL